MKTDLDKMGNWNYKKEQQISANGNCGNQKDWHYDVNANRNESPDMLLYTRWTREEDAILEEFYPTEGGTVAERLAGRTTASCQWREYRLGIERRHPHKNGKWTQDEDNILRFRYPEMGIRVAQFLPWRTPKAIKSRAAILGLHREVRLQVPAESRFYYTYCRKRKLHGSQN